MFEVDSANRKITMHQGDTGSYEIQLTRTSGASFGADDRMLYTVGMGNQIVMQRAYRLDTDEGNGKAVIEFHNADTEGWMPGVYNIEVRAVIGAYWTIEDPPDADVVDILRLYGALANLGPLIDGDVVRTNDPEEAWTLEIIDVIGEV